MTLDIKEQRLILYDALSNIVHEPDTKLLAEHRAQACEALLQTQRHDPPPHRSPEDYVCNVCGSDKVEHAHWVRLNTMEVLEPFGSWCNGDNNFCSACEAHNIIVRRVDLKREDKSWKPCSEMCPGYGIFNGNQIQRCDECNRFADDESAVAHVQKILESAGEVPMPEQSARPGEE